MAEQVTNTYRADATTSASWPSRGWLLWVRWLVALAVPFTLILLFKMLGWPMWMAIAFLVILAAVYVPLKQRAELQVGAHRITLELSMNLLGRLLLRVNENAGSQQVVLSRAWNSGQAMWLEPTVAVEGQPLKLLLYFRWPRGFMVSSGNEESFSIVRNHFCL